MDLSLFNQADLSDDGEMSCEGKPWDVDHDGVVDSFEATVDAWVTARDWLADAVNEPGNGCSGPLTNRGASMDYARYFWDMYTDESVDLDVLIALYGGAGPSVWDPDGSTSTTNDDPAAMLSGSAFFQGILTKHNNQTNNGIR